MKTIVEATIVEATCISKKESQSYNKDNPTQTAIELAIPYDQRNIYYQLSGGTTINLNTINKEAADMFKIGGKYKIVISESTQP